MGIVSKDTLEQESIAIVAKLADTTADRIQLSDRFVGDLGFDSLKTMECLARISDLLDCNLTSMRCSNVKRWGEVIDYMREYLP